MAINTGVNDSDLVAFAVVTPINAELATNIVALAPISTEANVSCQKYIAYGVLRPPSVPLVISCGNPPGGIVGQFYTHTFPVSGGFPPYNFSITGGFLPPGIILNSGTGVISGTLGGFGGTYAFTVTVTDAASQTASVTCSITILPLYIDVPVVRDRIAPHIWENNLNRIYDRIEFEGSRGTGLDGTTTGQPGNDPVIMLRYSDNYGDSFGSWFFIRQGKIGEDRIRMLRDRNGRARDRVWWVRTSDITYSAFSNAILYIRRLGV